MVLIHVAGIRDASGPLITAASLVGLETPTPKTVGWNADLDTLAADLVHARAAGHELIRLHADDANEAVGRIYTQVQHAAALHAGCGNLREVSGIHLHAHSYCEDIEHSMHSRENGRRLAISLGELAEQNKIVTEPVGSTCPHTCVR